MCSNRCLLIKTIFVFLAFVFPLCSYAQLPGKRVIQTQKKLEGFIILTGIVDFEKTTPKDMADLRKVKMQVLALPDSTVVIEGGPLYPDRGGFFTLHKGLEKLQEKYLLKISAEGFRDTTFIFNSKENISKIFPMQRKKDYGTIILKRK